MTWRRHLRPIARASAAGLLRARATTTSTAGSIAGVRAKVRELCRDVPNLHWLPDAGVVPLTETTCLVGHDGWGDGRLGDYHGSDVMLNDFGLIDEFGGFDEDAGERLAKLHALGDEAAAHFRAVLPDALARFRHVIVADPRPAVPRGVLARGADLRRRLAAVLHLQGGRRRPARGDGGRTRTGR